MAENYGGPSGEDLRRLMEGGRRAMEKVVLGITFIEHRGMQCTRGYGCKNPPVCGVRYDGSGGYFYQVNEDAPAYYCEQHLEPVIIKALERKQEKFLVALAEAEQDPHFGASYVIASHESTYACEHEGACETKATHFYAGDEGVERCLCVGHANERQQHLIRKFRIERDVSGIPEIIEKKKP